MKKLVVFDIDGTLLRTETVSVPAYASVMPALGLPVPEREQLLRLFGCNAAEFMQGLGVPPSLAKDFLQTLDREESRQMALCGTCYDGALPLLRRLSPEGYEIALCSLCSPAYMEAFLRKFDLQGRIAACRSEMQGSDKAVLLREILLEVAPDRAVMVGDRGTDIRAARENGIPSVGCLYGFAPEEAADADIAIASPQELYGAIRKLF